MNHRTRLAQLEKRTQPAAIGPTYEQMKTSISRKLFGTDDIPLLSDESRAELQQLIKDMQAKPTQPINPA